MPLVNLNLAVSLAWSMNRTNSGFQNTRQGTDSRSFNLNGVSLSAFNQLLAAEYTIPAQVAAPSGLGASLAPGGTLTVAQPYYYKITAVNALGETTASNEATATPTTGNQTVNLAWTADAGATGYKVYRGTAAGSENLLVATLGAVTSWADAGAAGAAGAPPSSNTTNLQAVDMTALTNLVYESFGFGHVLTLFVLPSGSSVTVQPGAANGLQWFFGGAADSVNVPAGGMLAYSEPAAGPGHVVDPTHKVLDFVNPGATPLTLYLIVVGGP